MKAVSAFLSAVLLGSLVFAAQQRPPVPTPAPGAVWPPVAGNPNGQQQPTWPPSSSQPQLPPTTPSTGGTWPPVGSNPNVPWPPMTPPPQQPTWPTTPPPQQNPNVPSRPSGCVTTFDCVVTATACKTANSMSVGEQDFAAAGTITYMTTTSCPSGQRRSTYVSVVGGQDARSCVDLENQYLAQTPQCQ